MLDFLDLDLKEVGRYLLLEVLKLWLIFGLVGDHSLSSLYFCTMDEIRRGFLEFLDPSLS